MNFDLHANLSEIATALRRPEILSAVVLEGGQNNLVLDTGELIIRVPRHDDASRDLKREKKVLAALEDRLPLPIPNITLMMLASDNVMAVHKKLPGTALLNLARVSGPALQQLADKLGAFLLALHALPVNVLDPADEPDDPLSEWSELLAEVDSKVLPLLPRDTAMEVRTKFEQFIANYGKHLPKAVIHGDFGTGNILVDKGEVSGIIDFGGCSIGDPAYDLASLAAGLGDDFLTMMGSSYLGINAMRERIGFYRSTFPLLDVLFGLKHGEVSALHAGLKALQRD